MAWEDRVAAMEEWKRQREQAIINKWYVHVNGIMEYFSSVTAFEVFADNFGYYGRYDELISQLRDTEWLAWDLYRQKVEENMIESTRQYTKTIQQIAVRMQELRQHD